jgi:hypothetical protein
MKSIRTTNCSNGVVEEYLEILCAGVLPVLLEATRRPSVLLLLVSSLHPQLVLLLHYAQRLVRPIRLVLSPVVLTTVDGPADGGGGWLQRRRRRTVVGGGTSGGRRCGSSSHRDGTEDRRQVGRRGLFSGRDGSTERGWADNVCLLYLNAVVGQY